MECSSYIEHTVAVEHFIRFNHRQTGNLSALCPNFDASIKISSGSLCYKNRSYIFPAQFFLGISGNFLIISVLNRKSMRSVTNYFLSCVAIADIGFFLSLSMSSAIVFPKLRDSPAFIDFYYHCYPYLLMFANFFSALSLWSVVGVTAERLIAVRQPLRVRLIFNRCRLIFASLAVCLIAMILSTFKIVHGAHILHHGCISQSHQDSPVHLVSRVMFVLFLTLLIGPIILVITFNVLLIFALRKSDQVLAQEIRRYTIMSSHGSSKSQNDRRITLLVMMTTICCVVSNTPSVFIGILKIVYGFGWLTTKPSVVLPLSNILVATDKTLHFFFYCFFSSKFRRGLKNMFSCNEDSITATPSKRTSETRYSISERGLHADFSHVSDHVMEALARSSRIRIKSYGTGTDL